jgi:HK97 family phage portal protein
VGAFSRMKSLFGFEGASRGPFNGMGELGGMYALGPLEDGWQRNLEVNGFGARHVPGVYACVMIIARSISQCYPLHMQMSESGITKRTKGTSAYRVLRSPNTYQTGPEFLLNLIAMTLFDGEAFALCTRDERGEIDSLHLLPRGTCSPRVVEGTREVFYSVGSSPLAPGGVDFIAPARDVLHLKFHTPRHPLIGESPIRAAALAIGINVALSQNQAAFFSRMSRPSGVISTDQVLTREQMGQLRAAWQDQAKGLAAGGIPILSGGLKWQPLSVDSQDAQLVQAQQMSLEDICRVFGVPPPLVGDLSHATLNNSETLVRHFLSMSLGSYLELTERAFDRLFGVPDGQYIEFDTTALLRTDFQGRIDGLTKAVQGGLFTPDEARALEGLSPIEGGGTAYLQRQMTPIDKIGDLLEAEAAAKKAPEPAPVVEPDGDEKPEKSIAPTQEERGVDPDVMSALLSKMMRDKREKTHA